ncbi:MAG: hypothetical protein U1E73_11230 [Planctomycetota bacterium]
MHPPRPISSPFFALLLAIAPPLVCQTPPTLPMAGPAQDDRAAPPPGPALPRVAGEIDPGAVRTELRAELGIGRLEIASQDGPAVALHLAGSGCGELLGLGIDVNLIGSVGELGEFDSPGLTARISPFLSVGARSDDDDWTIRLRLGPEFVHIGAGDELYAEYDGIGGRLDVDAMLRLHAGESYTVEGYLGLGFGMGSGDGSAGNGFAEVEFDDDHATLDVELGLGFRSGGSVFSVAYVHQDVSLDEADASAIFDGIMLGWRARF